MLVQQTLHWVCHVHSTQPMGGRDVTRAYEYVIMIGSSTTMTPVNVSAAWSTYDPDSSFLPAAFNVKSTLAVLPAVIVNDARATITTLGLGFDDLCVLAAPTAAFPGAPCFFVGLVAVTFPVQVCPASPRHASFTDRDAPDPETLTTDTVGGAGTTV
jgi:hypothetical protein